jgi:hypothetical protein
VLHWSWVVLGYVVYLGVCSLTSRDFAAARLPLVAAILVAGILVAVAPAFPTALQVIVPALALLVGYKLSGLFFKWIDLDTERRLQALDDRLLRRTGLLDRYERSPQVVRELFELSYFLIYPAVPAGAATLALAGFGEAVEPFWTIVLIAELACYGVLPWIQTRPPMLLEPGSRPGFFRNINQAIAAGASIRANTIPSGHAAGAFATAFAVGTVMPGAGAAFFALAVVIATASVLGRYHYLLDSVLGVLVAVGVWIALSLVR